MSPEKGAVDAIALARRTGRRLRVAAKEPTIPIERDYYENVFLPAARTADVEYLGELGRADRDRAVRREPCLAHARRLARAVRAGRDRVARDGTPVVARRAGGIPEIVRDGIDGIVDDSIEALAQRLERSRRSTGRPSGNRSSSGSRPVG